MKYDASFLQDGHNLVLKEMLPFHQWLGNARNRDLHRYSVAVRLSTMAIAKDADIAVLQTLAMFFKSSAFTEIPVLDIISFNPSKGKNCLKARLHDIAISHRRQLSSCPKLPIQQGERQQAYQQRRVQVWASASGLLVQKCVSALVAQWPIACPDTPSVPNQNDYINTEAAMLIVKGEFKFWHDNLLLNKHLESIQQAASSLPVQEIQLSASVLSTPSKTPSISGTVSELDVFMKLATHLPAIPPQPSSQHVQGQVVRPDTSRLNAVLKRLEAPAKKSGYEHKYSTVLNASRDALETQRPGPSSCDNPGFDVLTDYLHQCEQHVQKISDAIGAALGPCRALVAAGHLDQWPGLSPTFFLQQLARKRWSELPKQWKSCIVQYGLALAALQRARRLCSLSADSRHEDVANKIQNSGHQNWDPMEHPETLLMEIESNITV